MSCVPNNYSEGAFKSIQTNQPLVYNNKQVLRLPYTSSSFYQRWSDYDNNHNNYNNNNNNKFDFPQTDFPEATIVAASSFVCINTWIIIICKCESEAVINKWLEGIARVLTAATPHSQTSVLHSEYELGVFQLVSLHAPMGFIKFSLFIILTFLL